MHDIERAARDEVLRYDDVVENLVIAAVEIGISVGSIMQADEVLERRALECLDHG